MSTAAKPKPLLQPELHHAPPRKAPHPAPEHFLFLASSWCDEQCGSDCVHKKFEAVARCMMEDGYVYLARPGQEGAEDDDFGVRHLPLNAGGLPFFGRLTATVVLDDAELLRRSRQQYPKTPAYHLQTSPTASQEADDAPQPELPPYTKLSSFCP